MSTAIARRANSRSHAGNLGTPILRSLLSASNAPPEAQFDKFVACVRSEASEQRLGDVLREHTQSGRLEIVRGDNVRAVRQATVVILGVDPADVETTLSQEGVKQALRKKLFISIVAGWSRTALEQVLEIIPNDRDKTWVLRTLPNVAAQVSQSLTAIEDPAPNFPAHHMSTADAIFSQVGKTVHIAPRLMAATTAVGGSTPAFWAIICDALIDAAVAVGLPRPVAQAQIYQSMRGTAEMLQSGMHPGTLRDQGTSPEGCTIGGIIVLEEEGVRGSLGKALREAVTIARLMGSGREDLHVNDTRQQQ